MRVVFWGSPDFAVATLGAVLASAHQVAAVVTRPPRPAGRGRRPEQTAVARVAEAAGVSVLTPQKPRGDDFLASLGEIEADVFLVAAYGAILPAAVLEMSRRGALNVHASLLPEYRGAAPVTRAILEGRTTTGVTIMRMDAGLDTGPICLQEETPIEPDDTAGTVSQRLAVLGARLAVQALDRLEDGTLVETPQDDAVASYAPKVTPGEAGLDWNLAGTDLERAVRAFDPWPGAWTRWKGERLKIYRLAPIPHGDFGTDGDVGAHVAGGNVPPGTLLAIDPAPIVRVGDGAVRLAVVQPAAGRRMSGAEWARGRAPQPGDRLGSDV